MKFKKIKLELINGTENIDITQLVKNVTWSGSYQQACRKLEFSVVVLFNLISLYSTKDKLK